MKVYRARELIRLVEETGHITTMPYELMLNTLDYIEIGWMENRRLFSWLEPEFKII